jgi:hypothetical protein
VKKTVAKNTSTDAFIHVSITTWETANMDLAVTFLTLFEDKLTDQNQLNKLAKSFITKTTAQMETSADILTISDNIHVFIIQLGSANFQMPIADIHTKKSWTFQLCVFLTLWAVAQTPTAKTLTTSITSLSISLTMDLSEQPDQQNIYFK